MTEIRTFAPWSASLRDLGLGLGKDPGVDRTVAEAVAWIGRAQDFSSTRDGGVAHSYSLRTGWGPSYPETTGYIVPTLIDVAEQAEDNKLLMQRVYRMLDWLVGIQLSEGAFQGGTVDATPLVPTSFNTGQILLGLAAAAAHLGEAYLAPMHAAARWLVDTQNPDGSWSKHSSPFAAPGPNAYDTHVAWGLLEAARVAPSEGYAEAALANVDWALGQQAANGWFARCCLADPGKPLTHTLGYAVRGVLEAHRYTGCSTYLEAARLAAAGLLGALRKNGFLPGRLDRNWTGTVRWACLTGSVQVAHCWLMLYQETGDARYREAAFATNRYVRRTVKADGPPETRGAVKGAFPVWGRYQAHAFPNWAAKFSIDANLLERSVRGAET